MRKRGPATEEIRPWNTSARGRRPRIRRNNDEASVKGTLLFYCVNVFHVRDKAFPAVLHFKESGGGGGGAVAGPDGDALATKKKR